MKYRSRMDIIAMILETANNGATKTRIMYGAFLSYAQVKEYLEFLTARNLLRYEKGTQLYKLTETGLRFLRIYSEIGEVISLDNTRVPVSDQNTVSSESFARRRLPGSSPLLDQ